MTLVWRFGYGKSRDIPPELKESSSSSSSSDNNKSPKNYNSDTSSTQSSSGGEDNKITSIKQSSSNERGRSQQQRRRRTRRDVMALQDGEHHLQFFSHGRLWTVVGIVATWIGFAFAYNTFTSTKFVELSTPFYVDPIWNEVTQVGMINLQLCYNETYIIDQEEITSSMVEISTATSECTIYKLTSDDIDDTMFQASRSMAFLAILVGGFMSFFLTSAIYWHSINLRPIGFGYLLAYFLQSFTFLFFDSTLCEQHGCALSTGGKLSAMASICWIISCVAAARMDSFKFQNKMEQLRARSPSRSRSPRKKIISSTSSSFSVSPRKKTLERRTTDGTSPLSDGESVGSIGSMTNEEMLIMETGWRRPGHMERRFASNGCEIIQGIQDPAAIQAWAARSPRVQATVSPTTTTNVVHFDNRYRHR